MQNIEDSQPTLLVAGAGGRLGYRVVEILSGLNNRNLVAASRNPTKLSAFENLGIQVRKADFEDIGVLYQAFDGINRLLLISTDELHRTGARIRQHLNAIHAAKTAGIEHIVYTSMPNPAAACDIPFAQDHVTTEQALEDSGIGFTSLRISWYAENMLGFLPQIIATGKWPTAAGNGAIAYIPREDVAQVTAAALLKASGKQYWNITGPERLTIPQIASIASEVFGKVIQVTQLEKEQLADALAEIAVPREFTPTVLMTDLNTRAGHFDMHSDIVEEQTGRAPGTLKAFFTSHRDLFLR